jgi:hypothetical protein
MIRVFDYLDGLIQRWIAKKYKLLSKAKAIAAFRRRKGQSPAMLYHWKFGIKQDYITRAV